MDKQRKVRIQGVFPPETAEELKQYADKNGLSVAAAICMLVTQQLRGLKMTTEIVRVMQNMTPDQLNSMIQDSIPDMKKAITLKNLIEREETQQ